MRAATVFTAPGPAVDRDGRRLRALAALQLDHAGRQLSTLAGTYPAWLVQRERDGSGQVWWVATLRQPLIPVMAVGGVQALVRRPDPIALAAELARQTALLHNAQARTR